MLNKIKHKFFSIPFRYFLIIVIINVLLFILFQHIIVRIVLFLFCSFILFYFGKNPFADFDPVPFCTALVFIWHGYSIAFQFLAFTIPVSDLISGRLSQFTFVNLISLALSITILYLIKFPLIFAISLILIIFNISRMIVNLLTGKGLNALIAPLTNTIIYLILTSLIAPIISATFEFFAGFGV
ncbi:MAG: hypothetical protein ABIJ34_00690 [archaeon]